ncbi:MAG: nucleotidyltransferase family protein [Clostridiales Family XIII bacterium]|jgi:predicted nucleotidyltransferase|nr:nucleotidyltransferase family protein [Clostridiales Family XIII bacterium]
MAVLGIIAEYDPFHNGHLYHLKESLTRTGAEASVCVMSGCFTQRGLPAMFGKRARAGAAAGCGVDLVIELPFVYAANNAEYFARGAVRILDGLGVVDFLSFGSESGEVAALSEVAALFADDSAELNAAVRSGMSDGLSYPAARDRAVAELLGAGAAALMREPNNILAIEYMKELRRQGSAIEPFTIKRYAAGAGEVNEGARVAGATAIRGMFERGGGRKEGDAAEGGAAADGMPHRGGDDPFAFLPESSANAMREYIANGSPLASAEALFPFLAYAVIMAGSGCAGGSAGRGFELAEILSATEGLENRLVSAVRRASNMYEAVRYTKTRRYTETRVRRLILHTVAGLTKELMAAAEKEPPYARVLAFTEKGAKLIRRAKKEGGIPFVSNSRTEKELCAAAPVTAGFDRKAEELYGLLRGEGAKRPHV